MSTADRKSEPDGEWIDMSKLTRYAYIFKAPGFAGERTVMDSGLFRAVIVAAATFDEACDAAKELAAEGVELIELCGSFHAEGAEAVSRAIGGAIPVGYVSEELPAKA